MKVIVKNVLALMMMLLVSISNNYIYAETFSMSDEELDKAIETFVENLKKESQETEEGNNEIATDMSITRENDTIIINYDGEIIEFKYDFSENCKFYADVKYDKNMTLEQAQDAGQKGGGALFGFLIMSSVKGNSALDSIVYVLFSALEGISNANSFVVEEGMTGLEYGKKVVENSGTVENDLYKAETVKISETEDELTVRNNFIVKMDGDFSVVKGMFDSLKDLFEENNNDASVSENNNNNNKELPKAGIDITTLNILKISIAIIGVIVVLLIGKLVFRKNEG